MHGYEEKMGRCYLKGWSSGFFASEMPFIAVLSALLFPSNCASPPAEIWLWRLGAAPTPQQGEFLPK